MPGLCQDIQRDRQPALDAVDSPTLSSWIWSSLAGHNRVDNANKILRQLQGLEVLVVERYLDGYELFSGLGHEPGSPRQPGRLGNGPFLKEVEFFVQSPKDTRPKTLPASRICDGNKINLQELEEQVVDRFMFLEKLRVHLHGHIQLALAHELDGWKKGVWRKLGDEGVQTPSIDLWLRRV
ncbi:hypothetical protein BGX34_005405 [Mortierella sp. NVP85]|nr:hypothetical protein BGX34_005405 [Mortierella sp. NVP85]